MWLILIIIVLLVFRVYAFHLQNKKVLWFFIVPAGAIGVIAYVSLNTPDDENISLTTILKISFHASWKQLHSTSNLIIARGCITPVYETKQYDSSSFL